MRIRSDSGGQRLTVPCNWLCPRLRMNPANGALWPRRRSTALKTAAMASALRRRPGRRHRRFECPIRAAPSSKAHPSTITHSNSLRSAAPQLAKSTSSRRRSRFKSERQHGQILEHCIPARFFENGARVDDVGHPRAGAITEQSVEITIFHVCINKQRLLSCPRTCQRHLNGRNRFSFISPRTGHEHHLRTVG